MGAMSVKRQLTLAFGFLVAVVVLVCVVSLTALNTTNQSFTSYTSTVARQGELASQLAEAVNQRAVAARNLVLVVRDDDLQLEKASVVAAHQSAQALLAELKASVVSQDRATQDMVARIAEIEQRYGPVALDIVDKALTGQRDAAITKMNDECRPLLAALLKAIAALVQSGMQQGHERTAQAAAGYQRALLQLVLASVFAVAAAVLLGWWITHSLLKVLGAEPREAAQVAEAVAQGDLSTRIQLDARSAGSLMAQLQHMQRSLGAVVADVRSNAYAVADASADITQGNGELNTHTEDQAAALEQTAVSMQELGRKVEQNADSAQAANTLAVDASHVTGEGAAVVTELVATVKSINDSAQRIADIVGVIDSIAFQTNILALNAAVEAARAGHQGRGFAVVAGEVRALAGRSAEAAREIKQLIDSSVSRAKDGMQLANQAGQSMQQVESAIQRVTAIMGEISAASQLQSMEVSQVGAAIAQMERSTQTSAQLVQASSTRAAGLNARAAELVQAVAVFRLP